MDNAFFFFFNTSKQPLSSITEALIELGSPQEWNFFFFFFLFLFRATPLACGSSQVRGPIGATAAGLYHSPSNMGSEPHPQPTPQLRATPDP